MALHAVNSKGDEFYTPMSLVRSCIYEYGLKHKKIYLPFDTEASNFYILLEQYKKVLLGQYKNFFDTPVEALNMIADNGFEIFTNPPFSRMEDILKLLRQSKIKYSLFCNGLNWGKYVAGTLDSVHYLGLIKYYTPVEYAVGDTRPIRTVLITNDNLHVLKKASFVPSYHKPYKGKVYEEISGNMPTFSPVDANIITIRDHVVDLSNYEFVKGNMYGTFIRKDVKV